MQKLKTIKYIPRKKKGSQGIAKSSIGKRINSSHHINHHKDNNDNRKNAGRSQNRSLAANPFFNKKSSLHKSRKDKYQEDIESREHNRADFKWVSPCLNDFKMKKRISRNTKSLSGMIKLSRPATAIKKTKPNGSRLFKSSVGGGHRDPSNTILHSQKNSQILLSAKKNHKRIKHFKSFDGNWSRKNDYSNSKKDNKKVSNQKMEHILSHRVSINENQKISHRSISSDIFWRPKDNEIGGY